MLKKKVLCVDDEELILSALKRELGEFLDERGLEFASAPGVDEAIRLISADPEAFALVVSDLKMPNKKGTVLIREIKDKWPDISTILLTGYSEIEDLKDAIRQGILSFIQKPWDREFLRIEIDRGLQLHELRKERTSYLHRLEQELKWAKRIHQEILKTDSIANPNIKVGFAYQPYSETACGGDFFHLGSSSGGALWVVFGDIAIHGVEGTYFALRIREILKEELRDMGEERPNPGKLLSRVNDKILSLGFQLPDLVMTLCAIAFDGSQILYSLAGNTPFYHLRKERVELLSYPSPGIGYKGGIVYPSRSLPLEAQDKVFLLTDGALNGTKAQDLVTSPIFLLPSFEKGDLWAQKILSALGTGDPPVFCDDASVFCMEVRRLE